MSLGRFLRTVRWLRTEQLVGRLRHRLRRPRADLRAPPLRREITGAWVKPAEREPSLVAPGCWRFLNEAHELSKIGWDGPEVALLWRYNQHYFDDLNAVGAEERRSWHVALLERWANDNPPGHNTAWAPYPTSLRIVNLVKACLGDLRVDARQLHSLAVQARWLSQCLEWHLLGNHLFANAKALVFAGLFFVGDEAESWLAVGLRILARELPEQFLEDGAQFERTPMYQALAVEDLLDLLNVIRCLAPVGSGAAGLAPTLVASTERGMGWLQHMLHADGTLGRFNDSADGIAPSFARLRAYAISLGLPPLAPPRPGMQVLRPSGYVSWREQDVLLLADVAPIGPDYLPGHAHADTLSFEVCVHGRELLVNRGTSIYGEGARRQLERGTAAHSTVQIEGRDSSEVWAGFRVGRRARVRVLQAAGRVLEAAHDGYAHLRGKPQHRRRWTLQPGSLLVEDWLDTGVSHAASARYHLAPGLRLRETADRWQVIDADQRVMAEAFVDVGAPSTEAWEHALAFGLRCDAQTLVVRLDRNNQARVRWTW